MQFLFRYCGPSKNVVTVFIHIFSSPSMLAFSVCGSDGLSVQCCNPRIYFCVAAVVVVVVVVIAVPTTVAAAAVVMVVDLVVVVELVTRVQILYV
jgi:hypothetical protein